MTSSRVRWAWALFALSACGDRGCGVKPQRAQVASDRVEPRAGEGERARCRAEVAQSAVAVVPGNGPIESLHATCDGAALSAWVVRGHTLTVTQRALREGSSWTPASTVATSVEGLSVLGSNVGPVAWRAPTAAIEGMDNEEWWTLWRADPSSPWRRASVGFDRALQSRGIIAAIGREGDRVSVLASAVNEDDTEPRVVRVQVAPAEDSEGRTRNQVTPAQIVPGELRGYASRARIALIERVEGVGADARARVEAFALEGDALRSRGAHTMPSATAIVTAQGAGTEREAAFALASFSRVPSSERGCLPVGQGLCVRPGPVLFARVSAEGMRVIELAREGLADSIAIEADGATYVVMYVVVEAGVPVQRAARVAADGTIREQWPLRARGLPPLDRPVVLACGGESWLVGEALVGEPDEDSGAQETGVIAVPLGCTRE